MIYIKKLVFVFLFVSTVMNAQNFDYDENGLYPKYVVTELDKLDKQQLFGKTINWVKETYVNPDEVIKTTIDNEKIRITGSKSSYICQKALGFSHCFDVRYTIEVSFKEGKYKFEPLQLEVFQTSTNYSGSGWQNIDLNSGEMYFRRGKARNISKDFVVKIPKLFNVINKELKLYLSTKQKVENEDW